MTAPIRVATARLTKQDGHYAGHLTLWGFRYPVKLYRDGDGLELQAFDRDPPEVVEGWEVTGVDEA